ncbi:16S rRNA (guanine(966)-N(2))-methyltransferase RsmD [Maribrevibacterium harenarium]|uniref:Ribosomal RNA small subunit methyltransferase D n=1 Tax=Maribrevibacterium harenarium TaxID=2589817 RepID=A0A501WZ44_9GAMM|nr:16S rRNA (guanine(966)-N(2))-methyltransferase RsmD [Maribrevibacterium harenarium]TPE53980.1 16S rRNA (guanine(966)-N(2))-methyltransferase RsmD [Maribrevibacterium harenarium]
MTKRSAKTGNTKSASGASKLRIIGGQWRSRQLPVPLLEGLRPTPDRVRETLFNWLNFEIPGARCLDLFCGSGALGLEALSREAAWCSFVDASPIVAKQIKANLTTLGANHAEVHHTSAVTFLQSAPASKFDVVFLDPPFRHDWLNQVLPLLNDAWLNDNAYIYLERESEAELPPLPASWLCRKEKRAGQLTYSLYQRQP